MKDLDDMNVLELVEESTVPMDAQILDCGWAMKMKSPSEVRARVVLKDYDTEMFVVLRGVVRVGSQHVRCESERSCMQLLQNPSFAKPPVEQSAAGWLWLIKKAMDGMISASKDFGDLLADVMKEIQFERGKADPQIYKDTNPKQQSCSTLTTPILAAASHQQAAHVWNRLGEHMLLKAHEFMTPDRPIKYLSRQYLKVHTHGRRIQSPFPSRIF